MRQIVPLDESDAMFAGHRAFHFDCVYDHTMYDFFGEGLLFVVEEDNCFDRLAFRQIRTKGIGLTMKVAITHMTADTSQ